MALHKKNVDKQTKQTEDVMKEIDKKYLELSVKLFHELPSQQIKPVKPVKLKMYERKFNKEKNRNRPTRSSKGSNLLCSRSNKIQGGEKTIHIEKPN